MSIFVNSIVDLSILNEKQIEINECIKNSMQNKTLCQFVINLIEEYIQTVYDRCQSHVKRIYGEFEFPTLKIICRRDFVGYYFKQLNQIRISAYFWYSDKALEHILFHELTHFLEDIIHKKVHHGRNFFNILAILDLEFEDIRMPSEFLIDERVFYIFKRRKRK